MSWTKKVERKQVGRNQVGLKLGVRRKTYPKSTPQKKNCEVVLKKNSEKS